MTTAGQITLGVDLDADDLSARLGEAVRNAIAPALAEINRELNKVQREHEKTARAAEKSAAKQVAAERGVQHAVDEVGNAHTRAAAKATTAGGITVRQVNAVTRALLKQAAAWNAVAAAQTAAAGAPRPGPPGAGGGGGGGPPRGPGANAGGFMRGGKGAFGFLTSPVGLNLGALGASALPAATTAVVNLVGAVQALGQSMLVLPGLFAGAASSIGVAAIGFQGMGDAVKALNEAAKSGDPKDLEKVAEALKHMAPEAVAVAKTFSALTQGPLRDLQKMVAGRMFAGFDRDLQGLADKAVPRVSTGFGKIADAWNSTLKTLTGSLGSDKNLSIMDRIFGNTAEGQKRANAAIDPLIHGFGTLAAAGTDFLPRLADGLTKLAQRFDDFITKADGDGRLAGWIDTGFKAMANFGESLLNIGKIITDITGAAGGDGGFLKWLRDVTTTLRAFTSSDEGQAKLTAFFREGKERLDQWLPILADLARVIGDIFKGFQQWGDVILPILGGITGVLADMPGLVTAAVTGLLAFKTFSGLTSLLGTLTGINGQLGGITGKAGGLRGALGSNRFALGAGGLAAGAISQATGGVNAANIFGTIGSGALAGSAAGPWGAAAGALAGAAISLTNVFLEQAERIRNMKLEADADRLKAPPALPAVIAPTPGPGQPGTAVAPPPEFANLPGQKATLPGLLGVPGAPAGTVLDSAAQSARGLTEQLGAAREQVVNAVGDLGVLSDKITTLPEGKMVIDTNSEEVLKTLETLGYNVTKLPTGKLLIQVAYTDARGNSVDPTSLGVGRTLGISGPPLPRKAMGGPIWGGVPGRDSVPILAMPGEHMLTTADVAAMGGQAGVYAFRHALHNARGYADGGAIAHLGTGLPPGDPVVGLLSEIRDLLAGKGGAGNPLATTADGVSQLVSGDGGTQMGPFGTPLKKRGDPGYEMAAAAISALGGDPEKFLGMDPSTYVPPSYGVGPAGVAGAGGIDPSRYAAALSAFAMSGNVSDVTGLGLDANDPVVRAIVAARNKKKGALGSEAISGLIGDVFGGGFTGTLDSSNSALVAALQTYREKLAKGTAGGRGNAAVAGSTGVPMTGLPMPIGGMDPLSAYAQSVSGGQYEWGASDLSKGLSDCSGAVSDLVEIITKGQADSGRLFNAGPGTRDALTQLGAVEGAIPGALQIGWDNTHMRSTLPNGVAFESGGQTGQGATYGGNARGAQGMANIMSLPVGALPPGLLAGGMGGLGGAGMAGTGTPVFVTNWPGQGGGGDPLGLLGGLQQGVGEAANNVIGDVMGAGLGRDAWAKTAPDADLAKLVRERNPAALAAAMGLSVQDFTRQGGVGVDQFMKNDGERFDAQGRLFSDTASLSDRTSTDLTAQIAAMREQLVDVIDQMSEKLNDQALEPVVKAGVQSALESLKDSVSNAIGTSLGNAAAPPIADAVSSAVSSLPIDNSGAGGGNVAANPAALVGNLFAEGGPVGGGIPGKDSVPSLLMPGEHVFTTREVAAMGGQAGVYAFRHALMSGGVRRFATGGGVVANETLGAEFFGVSQVPILGTIVNVLIKLLLGILGIEIEARDTLQEMTGEFRQFRGDSFKAYDAQGRLLNDTSALIDRSDSSKQAVADERIRILKIVIEEVIKYLIEKIVVPIGKAVANAAIQAGASAAGAAVNTQAPGAGGIVSSLISSGGQAGVEIIAEIGSDLGVSLTGVLTDVIAELIQTIFPGAVQSLFSGDFLNFLFKPLGDILGNGLGGIMGLFGGLLGGLSFGVFDSGGIARGKGFLPKAVNADELVLDPVETDIFTRFVSALESGGFSARGGNRVSIHAPFTVTGGAEGGAQAHDRLLSLIP